MMFVSQTICCLFSSQVNLEVLCQNSCLREATLLVEEGIYSCNLIAERLRQFIANAEALPHRMLFQAPY